MDGARILLISLPPSHENFVQSFIVGKDTVSLEEVRSPLYSRGLRQKAAGKSGDGTQVVGLTASEGQRPWNSRKKKSKPLGSKGPKPGDIRNYCKETGH